MPTAILFFQSTPAALFTSCKIDAAAGIIRGISVITEGPALGHGMVVDQVTLAQMKAAAETYAGGLKVKVSRGRGHQADFGEIVGALKNFQIVGSQLLADLHLLNSAPDRAFVLEVAEKMPDSFGMSVAFSGQAEERDGIRYARCTEIYSSDLVGEPAANPNGLFSQRFDEWQKTKGNSPETTQLMENDLLKKIGELIDSKLAAVTDNFKAQISALELAQKSSLAKIDEATDRAVLLGVKEFAKTLGQPAGSAAGPSAPAAAPTAETFEALVKAHPKYATSKVAAQKEVMAAKPDAYRDYLGRCQKGETILF